MANGKIAEAYVEVRADTSKFSADLSQKIKQDLNQAEQTATSFRGRISEAFGGGAKAAESFRRALLPAVGALTAVATGAFKAAQAASDLAEEQSKSVQIFGAGAVDLQKFAADAAQAIGQSQQQALSAASTFGIFGKSAGLAGGDLVKFSQRFTVLASDLASFNNTTPEEAIIAIGAALRGESEPIRRFGVLLDDATLRTQAFKMGIIESTKDALTPQQRVLAATEQIFAQTTVAQGDFARTSDGLANQQRILAAEFKNAQVALGQAFLPALLAVVQGLTSVANVVRNNVPLFAALGTAVAAVSAVIIGVNVAMKAYNAVATITRGLNKVLGTSFTQLQTSLGVIGVVLAAATTVYGLLSASKRDTAAATDDLTAALQLEGEAQAQALEAALAANPELQKIIDVLSKQGVNLSELSLALNDASSGYLVYVNALEQAAIAGDITFSKAEEYVGILGDVRDALLNAAQAQEILRLSMLPQSTSQQMILGLRDFKNVAMETTEETKKLSGGMSEAEKSAKKLAQRLKDARKDIKGTLDDAMKAAADRLKDAKDAFDEFSQSVASAISSSLSFGQAQQDVITNSQALNDALTRQAEAQRAYDQAIMQTDLQVIADAQRDLADATQAVMDAQQQPMTFFDQLNAQANKATRFGELVQQLIGRGLSESALQQVLSAGVDAGTAIAEELLSGADNTLIEQANRIQATLDKVAQDTGLIAAQRFRSQGVVMGESLIAGINDAISRVQISLKSKKLTPKQIRKLERDFAVDIGFDLSTGTFPAMANGGIVRRPTTALIGEQGSEVVIPITRPARALELLESSGLGALVRANSQTATVSIQNATFQSPTDVDLIAQKVNAAASARILTA